MSKIAKKEPSAMTTSDGSLMSYVPKRLDVAFVGRVQTALEAADSGAVCLYGLRRTYSDEKVAALIRLHLVRLNLLLDMKRPLSDDMIDFITDEIISRFSYMNLADVWLVFRRAASGTYGEMFESLNPPKVLGWFERYWNERLSACETRSIQRGSMDKEPPASRSSAREGWNTEAFRRFKIDNLTKK